MKKLVLFLGAAIVAASCTNHVSYGKLEFDYPADVTISDKSDNDDGSMTIFFDKDKSEIDLLLLEVNLEDDEVMGWDFDKKGSYLAYCAYEMLHSWALDNEDISVNEAPEDWTDIEFYKDDYGDPEIFYEFEGLFYDTPYKAVIRSTYFGDYRITALSQGESEDAVDYLIDNIYCTAHLKEK